MSNSADEQPEQGISDEQLPEDLQPSDDNPLAQPLDPDDPDTPDPEELDVLGERPAGQDDDTED